MMIMRGLCLLLGLVLLGSCGAGEDRTSGLVTVVAASDPDAAALKPKELRMWMTVDERRFSITLIDNATASAFAALLPLTLNMPDLNGNEKHARLPKALPADAIRPGTIRAGDIMLYGTDTLVVFYSTFESTYSYTRIGRVDDPTTLAKALGQREVRIAFSKT